MSATWKSQQILSRLLDPTLSVAQHRQSLPIYALRQHILFLLLNQSRVHLLLHGHVGSGKSTQLPQYLDETRWTLDARILIVHSDIHSIQTSMERIRFELASSSASASTYLMGILDHTIDQSRIVYMTPHILLAHLAQFNPHLDGYSVIILDDWHLATTNPLMRLVSYLVNRAVTARRDTLKLIITTELPPSTTPLLLAPFTALDIRILGVRTKSYPVDICTLSSDSDQWISNTVKTCLRVHHEHPFPGDILIFSPSPTHSTHLISELHSRISRYTPTASSASSSSSTKPLKVLRLDSSSFTHHHYESGGMSVSHEVDEALAQWTMQERRVIVTTHAFSCVAWSGIAYVIDSGLISDHVSGSHHGGIDLWRGISSSGGVGVRLRKVTRDEMEQRAHAASLYKPGVCFRMLACHETEHESGTASSAHGSNSRGTYDIGWGWCDDQTAWAVLHALHHFHTLSPSSSSSSSAAATSSLVEFLQVHLGLNQPQVSEVLELLYQLGLINEAPVPTCTPRGQSVLELLSDMHSLPWATMAMMTCEQESTVLRDMCALVSVLCAIHSVDGDDGLGRVVAELPAHVRVQEGDLMSLVNYFLQCTRSGDGATERCLDRHVKLLEVAKRVHQRLLERLQPVITKNATRLPPTRPTTRSTDTILKCISSVALMRMATLKQSSGLGGVVYQCVDGQTELRLDTSSVLCGRVPPPRLVCYERAVYKDKVSAGRTKSGWVMQGVTAIDTQHLPPYVRFQSRK